MRDIEALDPLRQFGQRERVLQSFLNGAGIRFHHAEALIVKLLGIVRGKVEERSLVAARGNKYVHSCGSDILVRHLFREDFFQRFAIFEINGQKDVAWDVGLSNIQLGKELREELGGVESLHRAVLYHSLCGDGRPRPSGGAQLRNFFDGGGYQCRAPLDMNGRVACSHTTRGEL